MDTPVDLLDAAVARGVDPEGEFLLDIGSPGGITSYTLSGLQREVADRARGLQGALERDGVKPGTVHPIVLDTTLEGVVTLLALWRLGVVPAPLNPRLTERERAEAVRGLAGVSADGAQVVLWTSGTSGSPRGVALGFAAMATHSDAVADRLGETPTDCWLTTLSIAHVGGLMLLARCILRGIPVVVSGPLSPEEMLRLLQEKDFGGGWSRGVSHVSLVPTQLSRLLEAGRDGAPPETFRCALLGGAHTSEALLSRALAAGWPVALTYGMTEMTSQVATATPAQVREKPGSVGRPLEGVRIGVTPDGEIRVKGHEALAYLDGTSLTDPDGWYRTGDLGHLDEDGDLWVTGRRSRRIISGGVNVDPSEVEAVLRRHPAIVDVCVVGVPDPEWGEIVAAWVVPVEGEFELDEIGEWLRGEVAGPKRPKRWLVENDMPTNANGKIDTRHIRDRLRESISPGPRLGSPTQDG